MLFSILLYFEGKYTHHIGYIKDNTLLFSNFNLILQLKELNKILIVSILGLDIIALSK